MNPLLIKLGVPKQVQAFFITGDLLFCYTEHFEHFGDGFHRVPTTPNLWLAGKQLAREVIITSAAMEAIAFLPINLRAYPNLDGLLFVAAMETCRIPAI